ncbi:MAG TPA: hypothetical protein VGL53_17865, partial [Bryobacteraceae bacterium]
MKSTIKSLASWTRIALLTAAVPCICQTAGAQPIGTCFNPASYRSGDAIAEADMQRGSSYFVQR